MINSYERLPSAAPNRITRRMVDAWRATYFANECFVISAIAVKIVAMPSAITAAENSVLSVSVILFNRTAGNSCKFFRA